MSQKKPANTPALKALGSAALALVLSAAFASAEAGERERKRTISGDRGTAEKTVTKDRGFRQRERAVTTSDGKEANQTRTRFIDRDNNTAGKSGSRTFFDGTSREGSKTTTWDPEAGTASTNKSATFRDGTSAQVDRQLTKTETGADVVVTKTNREGETTTQTNSYTRDD